MNATGPTPKANSLGESPPVNGDRKTVPFDYTFRYDLTGIRDTVHTRTVTVSIEARFTAVSIGYGVVPEVQAITFGIEPIAAPAPIDSAPPRQLQDAKFGDVIAILSQALGENLLGARTAVVLRSGFKINPRFAEQILLGGAQGSFDRTIRTETFQAVAAPPEQIQFLYSIFDEGSGREFQSEPILNTAGLGTADGMRPFRYFARPIEFAPRNVIRMQIIEKSEFQGELHISLQGYKTLGAPGSPTEAHRLRRIRR